MFPSPTCFMLAASASLVAYGVAYGIVAGMQVGNGATKTSVDVASIEIVDVFACLLHGNKMIWWRVEVVHVGWRITKCNVNLASNPLSRRTRILPQC